MKQPSNEKFKTMIGGQALIEGILMRGPDKDAVVCRQNGELVTEVSPRKLPPEKSPKRWPLIRGVVNFFDSQAVGIKALMRSADLSPEETEEEPSKVDRWLEKKLGDEKFQKFLLGSAVVLGTGLSILLFFLLPMIIGGFFDRGERPGPDPAPSPLRHQLPAGGDDFVHPDLLRCILCAAGIGAGTGGHAGNVPVPAHYDLIQAAASAAGGERGL